MATITPKAPEALNDRTLDIWEPLLATAERVGGDWPKLSRDAAIALSGGESTVEERSVELLADIKVALESSGQDEITTKALLAALCADEERPWATYNKGKPISDRQVAKLLKQFSILSEDIYPPGEKRAIGYKRVRFLDAFSIIATAQPLDLVESGLALHGNLDGAVHQGRSELADNAKRFGAIGRIATSRMRLMPR